MAAEGDRLVAVGAFVADKALTEVGRGWAGGLWEAETVRAAFSEVCAGVELTRVDGGDLGADEVGGEGLGCVVGAETSVRVEAVKAGGLSRAGIGGAFIDVYFTVGPCVAGSAKAGVAGLIVDTVEKLGIGLV